MRERLVFQVGFNKCGSKMLHERMLQLGYYSAHHLNGELARRLKTNILENQDPLKDLYDYDAFFDQTYITPTEHIEGYKYYRQILNSYPGAIFILNTRPLNHWIESRLKHSDMVSRFMKLYGYTSQQEVVDHWTRDWEVQHERVQAEIPKEQLLFFDIENDDQKFVDEFLGHAHSNVKSVVVGVRPPRWYVSVKPFIPNIVHDILPKTAKEKIKISWRRYVSDS